MYNDLSFLFFFGGGGAPLGCPSGEKRPYPMASSGKPLGERQLAVPPGPNIILLSGMREETNDHVHQLSEDGGSAGRMMPPPSPPTDTNVGRGIDDVLEMIFFHAWSAGNF